MMHLHHDAKMRTTVDLPEKLHRVAIGLARHTGQSMSQTIVQLMERGLRESLAGDTAKGFATSPETGLPVARSVRVITADDVRALENDG